MLTDDLAIDSRAVLQIRPRLKGVRLTAREGGLGLRDIRSRHFARGKAILGLLELLLQHIDVVVLQIKKGRIPQHVHIGRGGGDEDILFGLTQGFARLQDCRFGLPNAIAHAPAVIEGLGQAHAADPGHGIRTQFHHALVDRLVRCDADAGARAQSRAPSRRSARHALVRRPRGGALLIKVGAIPVGFRQRARNGLGPRGPMAKRGSPHQRQRQKERPEIQPPLTERRGSAASVDLTLRIERDHHRHRPTQLSKSQSNTRDAKTAPPQMDGRRSQSRRSIYY